jgi:hypothetical protein
MNQIEALKRLDGFAVEAFSTRDAAALLKVAAPNAHMILRRLERQGFLTHLARGRWAVARKLSRLILPEHLAAPYPTYVSLQSALFHHGLIEQVPAVIYAVTIGRTRRVATPTATVSLHHLPPDLFRGFDLTPDGAKMAMPEKALFDLLYLAPGRSRLFAHLPEIEFPRSFRWSQVRQYLPEIRSSSRRTFVEERIAQLSGRHPSAVQRARLRAKYPRPHVPNAETARALRAKPSRRDKVFKTATEFSARLDKFIKR